MEKQTITKNDYLKREVNKDLTELCYVNGYHTAHDNGEYRAIYLDNEKQTNTRLFGIELEFEVNERDGVERGNIANYLHNNLDCYTERDSSLNYGIELISNAQSLKVWKTKAEHIQKVFNHINEYMEFTNNTGLHIHVNRDSLGDTIEKQNKIINNIILIVENFNIELCKIAGRSNSNWCKPLSDSFNLDYSTDIIDKWKNDSRYYQVNVTNNNTIEFRLFKATNDVSKILAFIELVNNICLFAKSSKMNSMRWLDLVTKNKYNELMLHSLNISSEHEFINKTLEVRRKELERIKTLYNTYKLQSKIIETYKTFVCTNYASLKKLKLVLNDNQSLLSNAVLYDFRKQINEFFNAYNNIDNKLSNYNKDTIKYRGKELVYYVGFTNDLLNTLINDFNELVTNNNIKLLMRGVN